MDLQRLEEAKRLIGQCIDELPLTVDCCDSCGHPTQEARTVHREREMLGAAIGRLTRVIDHRKLGVPV